MGSRLVPEVTNGDCSCRESSKKQRAPMGEKNARKTKMLDSNVTVRDTSALIIPAICKGATWQMQLGYMSYMILLGDKAADEK